MTVQQLIDRLCESGDAKWRSTAEIRVLDGGDHVIGEGINAFDVKESVNSVDIHVPY